jgi:hypothetical protein
LSSARHGTNPSTFSNIAFICDNPEVQVLLPQIIVGNESLLPKKILDDLSDKLPPMCISAERSASDAF